MAGEATADYQVAMACGCGGECCGQPKGLGYVEAAPMAARYPSHIRRVVRGPKGLGFLQTSESSSGGYGDFWGFEDDFWGGGGGGDFWGFSDPFWGGYYDPSRDAFVFPGNDAAFLPTQTGNTGGDFWGFGGDFWSGVQNAIDSVIGGGSNPPLLPYCPGGTYHPLNDPYACVPFPPETPEFERQQKAAAAHKAAQDALKAAAAKAQQQQGCPPNTGLVKNAQGQCVCPPGYAPNAQLKKCVLVNASLAAQSNQAPDWLKYALLALGAVVVVKAVKK